MHADIKSVNCIYITVVSVPNWITAAVRLPHFLAAFARTWEGLRSLKDN